MNARWITENEIEERIGDHVKLTNGDIAIIVRPLADGDWLVGIVEPDFSEFDLGEYLQTH